MADFVLTEEAEGDLWRIFEYGTQQFGEKQAERYFTMMYGCFPKIAEFPLLFPITVKRNVEFRFCVCGVDTIYYQVHENQVHILTIVGRQNF
jgi:toxin ParE1/3/4